MEKEEEEEGDGLGLSEERIDSARTPFGPSVIKMVGMYGRR